MAACQCNVFSYRREAVTKHLYPEFKVTVELILDFTFILLERQGDAVYGIIVCPQGNAFVKAFHESGPERFLIGRAEMQVSHIGIQVCFPL